MAVAAIPKMVTARFAAHGLPHLAIGGVCCVREIILPPVMWKRTQLFSVSKERVDNRDDMTSVPEMQEMCVFAGKSPHFR